MHTSAQRVALGYARMRVFGYDAVMAERKLVPSYDASMVRKLPAGKASGTYRGKGTGFDPDRSMLLPGNRVIARSACFAFGCSKVIRQG